MPRKLWFKNKEYGYGWYPASWEGWVVLLVYTLMLGWVIISFLPQTKAPHDAHTLSPALYYYLAKVFGLTALLLFVARVTGEKPEWRWRGKKIQ